MEIIEKKNTGTSERKHDAIPNFWVSTLVKERDGRLVRKQRENWKRKIALSYTMDSLRKKIYDFEDKDTTSAHPTYLPESCGSSDSSGKRSY